MPHLMGAGRRVVDATLALGILAAVAFPFAARAVARDPGGDLPRLDSVADAQVHLSPLRRAPAGELRALPIFAPDGAAEVALDAGAISDEGALDIAIASLGAPVLGPDVAAQLVALARNSSEFLPFEALTPSGATLNDALNDSDFDPDDAVADYPYRFGPVETLLAGLPAQVGPEQAAALSDLGGLLTLAAASFTSEFPNAGSIAFSLLDRARADGRCESQLNLTVVVLSDLPPPEDHSLAELAEAEERCGPGDPTARWLHGEFLAQRSVALVSDEIPQVEIDDESATLHDRALEVFADLQESLPGSATGWAGAADAELMFAYRYQFVSPFEARAHFRRALTLMERADQVSDDPDVDLGLARAHAGLGDHDAAAEDLRRAIESAPDRAVYAVRLSEQLEKARDFAGAAEAAGRVVDGSATVPDGRTVVPVHLILDPAVDSEDGPGLLTLRGSTDRPASFLVGSTGGAGAGGLSDLSFLPEFRTVPGVTGHDRWCPHWTQARDLVLAGRPEVVAAPGAVPAEGYFDIRPWNDGFPCFGAPTTADTDLLAAVARAETGDRSIAADLSRSQVEDARQELWRFAGDLDRAGQAIAAWRESAPDDARALDRAGEVAFLRDDLSEAADRFDEAAALADSSFEGDLVRAEALLKLGTVRELAGDLRGAEGPLREADAIASDLVEQWDAAIADDSIGFDESSSPGPLDIDVDAAAYVSYNARVQLGDTALRGRKYEEAAKEYAKAHEQEARLPTSPLKPVSRPEVLDNNEAVVLIKLGREEDGLEAARSAVAEDRANPLFRENQAFALRRLGRLDEAALALEQALASDPTLFTAANDLAVIRARQERYGEAVALLRGALEAEPSYALALFNLGVVLDRRGPAHILEAQGALARGVALDGNLRNANRVPTFDDQPFFTTLDLSKPLPADWSFATSNRRTSAVLAGTVTLLLLARLVGASFGEIASDQFQERTLARRERRPRRRFPRWIAVGVTLAAFLYPLARSEGATVMEYALLAVGVALLIAIYLRARQIARAGYPVVVAEYTWGPSVVIGAIATAVGLGYAVLPVAEEQGADPVPRIHAIGPVLLAGMSAVLFGLSALTHVPFTRSLAAAALVMTASVLAPVRPLDGAVVAHGHRALILDAIMIGLAILFALGVL